MGNADLSWEKCYTTNIGIDARFFDRFGVTIDLYNKNTSDLLYYAPLPNISGYTGQYKNVGAINNKASKSVLMQCHPYLKIPVDQ